MSIKQVTKEKVEEIKWKPEMESKNRKLSDKGQIRIKYKWKVTSNDVESENIGKK